MANARKLPSGAYQTRITKVINGRKITKSFTVHPNQCKGDSRKAKDQSELMARQWRLNAEDTEVNGFKVKEALDKYVKDRSAVLSPSTITDYKRLICYFDTIADICVDDLRTTDIQPLVNEWCRTLKAKTIKNRTSFLLAALDYVGCDTKFRIQYPLNDSTDVKSPDLEDVQMLLRDAPEKLKPILYLAAVGGLRRGELAGLKEKDISRDMCTIFVHADMVADDNRWVYKPFPKNGKSGTIKLPKFIIDMLPANDDPEAFVFGMNPTQISRRYERYRRKLGFKYSLHTLRHFAASFRSDLGIPRKYIEEVGRWEPGSPVLDRVYDNTLDSSRKKYTAMANHFVEDNLQFKTKKA